MELPQRGGSVCKTRALGGQGGGNLGVGRTVHVKVAVVWGMAHTGGHAPGSGGSHGEK